MPKNITLTVDTEDEFLELFNKLCDDVLMATPLFVRRQLLNFRGTDKVVLANRIRIEDIYKIIKQRKLVFSLKVKYTTSVYVKQVEPAPEPIIEPIDLVERMQRQKEQIPESLMPESKVIVEVPKIHVPTGTEIPDFGD